MFGTNGIEFHLLNSITISCAKISDIAQFILE